MFTSRLRGSTALGIVAVMASPDEYDRVSPPHAPQFPPQVPQNGDTTTRSRLEQKTKSGRRV